MRENLIEQINGHLEACIFDWAKKVVENMNSY